MLDRNLEEGVDYRSLSNLEISVIALAVLPLYFLFSNVYDQPFRGFVVALSAGAVLSVIRIAWPMAGLAAFWAFVITMIAAHLLLICFLPYTGDFHFGILFAPLVIADIYLWAKTIIAFCRGKQSGA